MLSSQLLLALVALAGLSQDPAASRSLECHEWHDCRQRALDALADGDYERFHDLAWRAVQTGPSRDPSLMYLVARAQSLSGRPHDALVMLGRLAGMGIASDAATNDDFRAVRALRDWPQLEALIASVGTPAAIPPPLASTSPAAASVVTPTSSAPRRRDRDASPSAGVTTMAPLPSLNARSRSTAEDALLVTGTPLNPTGLAYDKVSGRFVVGDRRDRKLVIIDERSHRVVDLVRSQSAGFYEITAFEIDPRRGDLWVVSAGTEKDEVSEQPVTALHKLQLVSGRPLDIFHVADQLKPARFDDVAVTAEGIVFVLDSAAKRIFRLQAETRRLVVAASLDADGLTSLAPVDDRMVYVACAAGIIRVEISTGTSTPLRSPSALQLTGFERIRWNHGSLAGIQRMPDGSQRAVSVRLAGGEAVALDVVEADVPMTDPTAATVSGNNFYFLTERSPKDGTATDIVVRRARLH